MTSCYLVEKGTRGEGGGSRVIDTYTDEIWPELLCSVDTLNPLIFKQSSSGLVAGVGGNDDKKCFFFTINTPSDQPA